jgi:hypothetical protein
MAARKSERMLAIRLAVMPAATGLTPANPALIAAMSSGMAAGSWPSRSATRFTAEIKSRRRVGESCSFRSSAPRSVASVAGLDLVMAPTLGDFLALDLDLLDMTLILFGTLACGPAWSREDRR